MDGWLAVILQRIAALYMKYFEKLEFRPYIHPVSATHEKIEAKHFELVHQGLAFPMHVRVYKRIKPYPSDKA